MASGGGKIAVTLRLTREERDILTALEYVRSVVTGATQSPNDILGPVVTKYLADHAHDPGVELSIAAASEARQAAAAAKSALD